MLRHRKKIRTASVSVVLFTTLFITSNVESSLSELRNNVTFKIVPAHVESTYWHNNSSALIQDVSENGILQNFTKNNGAYFDGTVPVVPVIPPAFPQRNFSSETDSFNINEDAVQSDDESELSEEDLNNVEVDMGTQTPSDSTIPEIETGNVNSEVSSLRDISIAFLSFTQLARVPLPFVNTSIIEEVSNDLGIADSEEENSINGASAIEQSDELVIIQEEFENQESIPEVLSTKTNEETSIAQTPSENILDSAIIFSRFGLPQLESGQFIRNMQLRVSLAASANVSVDELLPSINFEYSFGDEWRNAGTILIDEETSNALNGGYFLFALPNIKKVEELNNFSIRVSYNGEIHQLGTVFIDALWLEVDTEVFDRELLKARIQSDRLSHLKNPTMFSLLDTRLDFNRDELPRFSMSYKSQRNVAIQVLRNLFARKLAAVHEVNLLHVDLGAVGISPQVAVTNDGLISIQLTEEDKKMLRPGEYELQISVDEGGKIFTDTFNFQWGLLAVNPNQAEYQLGDGADISLGALTRNGNTLCDAHLNLYIIDPEEYMYQVDVFQSGLCNGNNVIDVPDYFATFVPEISGEYTMYLERINEHREVLAHTSDTFHVVDSHSVSISRNGPTRIFPPAPYPMELTVTAHSAFTGTLIELVPQSFEVFDTDATIRTQGDMHELSWDVVLSRGESATFVYNFDAPDLSPYLYTLGPATLASGARSYMEIEIQNISSTDEDGSEEQFVVEDEYIEEISTINSQSYVEHRAWQIASDATGNMILFWDNNSTIPAGWTCLSCGSGTFFQRFAQGGDTYNDIGGNATHTHTASGTVLTASGGVTEQQGSGSISEIGHAHTYTPTIGSASNLPIYRQLRVIQYTASAGEPAVIPEGAIGIFDTTVPTGWTRYSAQDGYYIRGEDTAGTTGGSNTHTHTITGTMGAATGGTQGARGPAGPIQGAPVNHTHTVSGNTATTNHEPPYIEVILGKADSNTTAPLGLISMWTDEVPGGWFDLSSGSGLPFNARFIKPSATYGATGGSVSHSEADVLGIVSSVPVQAGVNDRNDAPQTGAPITHTHDVNITNFSVANHLPPYLTVIFGKNLGNTPILTQRSYRWYTNTNNQTPTDPWPVGVSDLLENQAITATTSPLKNGDIARLRISALIGNATATASTTVKLQYAPTTGTCNAISTWTDVGASGSSAIWRGFNNTSVTDHSTLSTLLLASSTVPQTYEENAYTVTLPNNVSVGGIAEWDFVIQQNGAAGGTVYCFRMVETNGNAFFGYNNYPRLVTNFAPNPATRIKLFDNEKTASTSPWFEFFAVDTESENVTYQIQIDNDPDFSSTVIDHNSISNSTLFENLVVPSNKDPFTSGQLMRYKTSATLTNGTTYWWRVRARDPQGSNQWSDWANARSFTIDTGLTASAWYQTTQAQFDTNTLVGLETLVSNQVQLKTGSTTGRMTTNSISFADGSRGTAWNSLSWIDTTTSGEILYYLEFFTPEGSWERIPAADLPGNTAGFTNSPVVLLDLDVNTYNTLRVVADFTDIGGSPTLQNITLAWGYRVPTPAITRLFANEKVGTTTPTFEFTTSDPQNSDLTYQISWSTDINFSASTTRTSDSHTGFINANQGSDFDPFNSGDTIRFTVQNTDALTNGTTYWWRVRAKDTTGADVYSLWTNPRSFTVDNTVVVSTWYQTTQDQFNSNILSGTRGLPSNVLSVATTAIEAMVVYGEGVGTAPRYRLWNGSVWSTEGSALTTGAPIRWVVTKAGTTREEYVAATVGTDNNVKAQVFSVGAWGNLQTMTTSMGNVNARGFDVAYETLSGKALVVYCNGTSNAAYHVWNGTSWTSGGTIALASTNNCEWIQLASDPISDEIVLMARDSVGTNAASYEVRVWNGATWSTSETQGGARGAAYETMAIGYEASGDQALAVSGDGNPVRFEWRSWNGATWSGLSTETTITDNLMWAELVSDVSTDAMALCYVDESVDIGVIRWTGAAWTGNTSLSVTGNSVADRSVSCSYETTPGRTGNIMAVYSDTVASRYRVWNGTTWSTEASVSTIGRAATVQTRRTGDGTILALFFDYINDRIDFSSWNGTTWSNAQTLENDASVNASPYGEPFMMATRNSGKEGTTVVSPRIRFSDGVGPYWDEMRWVDSTPGTSEILYSVQYFDTGSNSWLFIPNSEIPGNSLGTTTSPIDLSELSISTYNQIRPYARLSCDGTNNCPELQEWTVTWAEGITISGTLNEYDRVASTTSGNIAVAVNGALQIGKIGSVSNGEWSISNVTVFPDDIVTVFVQNADDIREAVGVTRYDGAGDITGFSLYERHLAIGSDDVSSLPITNANIGLYSSTNSEDLFHGVTGTSLNTCADVACAEVNIIVKNGTTYRPSGSVLTHDIINRGTLEAGGNTLTLSGSWYNTANAVMATSTVVFSATTTSEFVDGTGSSNNTFYNVTFGTGSGSATWNLATPLTVSNNLTIAHGTLSRGSISINVAGNLVTGANGFWSGIGTTTFNGSGTRNWSDGNATLQNVGNVVIDGTAKIVQLTGNVAAQSILIGADDVLDASPSHYNISVYGNFINTNSFVPRNGTVFFLATTSRIVTLGSSSLYNATFAGTGGAWSFTQPNITVANNLTVSAGTLTLPTGTTTIAGSFSSTGGTFAHNNATVQFTATNARTIALDGGPFTNAFYNVRFAGSGSWTFSNAYATTTNDFRIAQGTVTFPSANLSVGGSFMQTGGAFAHNSGTVTFTSATSKTIDIVSSPFNSLVFKGSGSWSFVDASVTALGSVWIQSGELTLPSSTFSIGGSYGNFATVYHNTGTVLFNSTDGGETIDAGTSDFYNVTFNAAGGGWTIVSSATTTNNFTLTSASSFTLDSGNTLAVGNVFTNSVGGGATTWTSSTLSLNAGAYSLNTKTNTGDTYGTLRIAPNTHIKMWNSNADTYTVLANASLYSQDHANVDGELYIFGDYIRTSGNEYWSYATDFDGASLTGNERQARVYFAENATASVEGSLFQIQGAGTATTTVQNQGAGTYTIASRPLTTAFQYYDFRNLGVTGVSLLGTTTVSGLGDGRFEPGINNGTGLTVSSTTIDVNPALQIFRVNFSTTTAISATNVTQTDGTPASYWWFRNTTGNIQGEAFDNDTGDPGSIRWDDSSLVITISGTVYSDAGVTPMNAPVCNDVAQSVRVVVGGVTSYTGSCDSTDGTFSIPGVVVIGDPVITVYLDTDGGPRGAVVTKTPTADITNLDIYQNRVITRHEDASPLTIADMAQFDNNDDSDIPFVAATGTEHSLIVNSDTELRVFPGKTFNSGGVVTLNANASSTIFDGSLYIGAGGTFVGYGTSTITIGGSLTVDTGAQFTSASTTVLMNASTTGKTITTPTSQQILFNNLVFNGVGGGWNINGDIRSSQNITVTEGVVTGTANISVGYGSFTGNGTVALGGGTTTIERSNTLGGTTPWTFSSLTLGNGSTVGTTTPGGATTTILGTLTIRTGHYLDAQSSVWNLAGSGNVFVRQGTFLQGASTFRYSGTGATNVISANYYNLELMTQGGSPTYTATGLGLVVHNDLTVGGISTTTFNLNTIDPALAVSGDVRIQNTGILEASNTGALTVSGDWINNGSFVGNGGTVQFVGSGTSQIYAGASSFSNVVINGTGAFTIAEHATSTGAVTLTNVGSFTLAPNQSLAVGGVFTNNLGSLTTWTDSVLHLYGGGNYTINTSKVSDTYHTLRIGSDTQIRMWNSSANTYNVHTSSSLYSQNHQNINGDLYIFGSYTRSSGADHWSYATDFDGVSISGTPRKVDVYIADGGSVLYTGGTLSVLGVATASTTIQNQGSGNYTLRIGGNTSVTMNYYEVRNTNSAGLTFSGTPTVSSISYGNFEVSVNSGTAMTVGGTAINQNPAKTFTNNYFGTDGVASPAYNVTATGTSISSWRFTNHTGSIAGEDYDVDPAGDPGYLVWDDSAALITISGNVYSDEGTAVSSVCDSSTSNIHLRVAGLTSYTTSCATGTGAYSISNVAYSPGDSLIVYIDGETPKAATITEDPVTSISNLHLYENRVIVRHEGTDPLSIADMAVWDSSDDADIPFTATLGSPNTLSLPANRKLIVWSGKTFRPGGNVTVSGGGAGADYDGTLELYVNAIFDATGSETHTVGGSFISSTGATLDAETSTFIFTNPNAGRVVDTNDTQFYNLTFDGVGDWDITNTILTVQNNFTITQGDVVLPTGTTTVGGSLSVTGGTFDANGPMVFTGSGARSIRANGSEFENLIISGTGHYTLLDTNATATESILISSGTFTTATGTVSIGGNFINNSTFNHNNGILRFTSATSTVVTAGGSDLSSVTFAGSGEYMFTDNDVALLGSLFINSGLVHLASGTTAIGGSFINTGAFNNASGTVLFNSSDTGEIINPGNSVFYAVMIGNATGGWTITGDATTTSHFTLSNASSFTLASSTTLEVQGMFTNSVGGSATTWTGSTLKINTGVQYPLNTKTVAGDIYNNLIIGSNTALRAWNSAANVTIADNLSSFYSQDNADVAGVLNIYGNYSRSTGADHWSYATDFDGTSLTGSERQVFVYFADNATTTFTGGTLTITGANSFETTISNQGSGTYALRMLGGTFSAQYYSFEDMNSKGLELSGTTTITSLSHGSFELGIDTGALITLSATTLNFNAGLVSTGNTFFATLPISGYNIDIVGTTPSAWYFTGHSGNLAGEDFDNDGLDECGSVRWDDSACLLTQQSAYRFRNDNGGEGVPNSEWFDLDWEKRMRVVIENSDAATYTNAAVKLTIAYNSDMRSDFGDLRFTNSAGVTRLDHFIESYTASTEAVVWVRVPTVTSLSRTSVFMYYGNSVATDDSSDTTFAFIDTFEDGNISEYSGDTGIFAVNGTFAYEGSYGLSATGNETAKATDGIYRTDITVSQGQTLRFMQYVDTVDGSGDETCTMFGVQSPGSNNENYAVCLELYGTDRIALARDVEFNDTSGTVLDSTPVTYVTGWYEVEVDWLTNNTINVRLIKDGTLVATTSATDSTYTSGGVGFTFWFQHGGWDVYSSRPYLETQPTITFGVPQVPNGASWIAPRNTPTTGVLIDDIVRVRFLVENTGLTVEDQNYVIEYAPKGNAPSCEAVDYSSYVAVPPQSTCGTSDICMQSSVHITNLSATTDLLGGRGLFTVGQMVESPSNTTGNITIEENEFTELEYVITPTEYVDDSVYCLRVTSDGDELDSYTRIAELGLLFAPKITAVSLNDDDDIILIGGATTTVIITGTASDNNGFEDLVAATTTVFRSGVGASCTPDNNNCYVAGPSQCSFINCSGNSCDIQCSIDMYYHADPTDIGTYAGETWRAQLEVRDTGFAVATATAPSIDLLTLRAVAVSSNIDYGALEVNANTGTDNATTTVENIGNSAIDLSLEGTDLTDGGSSAIPVSQQIFATSTFNYSSCIFCNQLSTSPISFNANLIKPIDIDPAVTQDLYWGIAVPFGVAGTAHSGSIMLTPIPPSP